MMDIQKEINVLQQKVQAWKNKAEYLDYDPDYF